MITIEQTTDNRFVEVEKELSQLSLKAFVDRLDEIEPHVLRKIVEMEDSWLKELIEIKEWHLSSEEQISLETALRRAFPETKKEYEAKSGLPAPPPGYTYSQDGDNPPELIKYNTPIVRVKPDGAKGYGRWWLLSESEWERYKVLHVIAEDSKRLASTWDIQVSKEVVERAEELKKPLYEKSYGPKPSVSISSVYTLEKTPEDEALEAKLRAEAQAKLASQRKTRPFTYHRDDVIKVIREIETELSQR